MKIYLATDHAGFELKNKIVEFLKTEGYDVEDCGPFAYDKNDDYPDLIKLAAGKVSKDPLAKGIILGGSGQGEAIVANKFPNVRAVVYYGGPEDIITLSREHNDSNILSLGARFVDESIFPLLKQWLDAPFPGEERHARRIEKIHAIEARILKQEAGS